MASTFSRLSESSSQQSVCDTQLSGVVLFGSWRWSGTVHDASESEVIIFKSDCTYTDIPNLGSTSEGSFLVSGSHLVSITLTNKVSEEKNTYLISNVSENSFHASNHDYTVNLDFIRVP